MEDSPNFMPKLKTFLSNLHLIQSLHFRNCRQNTTTMCRTIRSCFSVFFFHRIHFRLHQFRFHIGETLGLHTGFSRDLANWLNNVKFQLRLEYYLIQNLEHIDKWWVYPRFHLLAHFRHKCEHFLCYLFVSLWKNETRLLFDFFIELPNHLTFLEVDWFRIIEKVSFFSLLLKN